MIDIISSVENWNCTANQFLSEAGANKGVYRERESVCVCVCVCKREREREIDKDGERNGEGERKKDKERKCRETEWEKDIVGTDTFSVDLILNVNNAIILIRVIIKTNSKAAQGGWQTG